MKKPWIAVVVALALAGCAADKYSERSVTRMQPGFGVMVATFKHVPGVSKFPQSTVLKDAKFAFDALSSLKYQSFIVYDGANTARIGIRAPSYALAQVYKKEFDAKGTIYLGGGVDLPVSNVAIVNIAELKCGAADKIP